MRITVTLFSPPPPISIKLPSGSTPQPAVTNSPTSRLTAAQHPITPPSLRRPHLCFLNRSSRLSSSTGILSSSAGLQTVKRKKAPFSASPGVFHKAVFAEACSQQAMCLTCHAPKKTPPPDVYSPALGA